MTVEEANTLLRAKGFVVEDGAGEAHPSLVLLGGESVSPKEIGPNEIRAYEGAFHVAWEDDTYVGRIAGKRAPDPMVREERGDLEHVVNWIIATKKR